MLFDLDTDVGERTNVAAEHREIVDRLLKKADKIRGELGDVNVFGSAQRPHGLVQPQEREHGSVSIKKPKCSACLDR